MRDVVFRFAIHTDASRLAKINFDSWQYAYKDIFPEHVLHGMSLEKLKQASVLAISHHDKKIVVLEMKQVVYGFVRYGKIDPGLAEFEIFQFYMDPKVVGKGLGTQLLQSAKQNIEANHGQQIVVKVAEKNFPARKFYEKFGFAQMGPAKIDCSVGDISTNVVWYRYDCLVAKQKGSKMQC